MPDMTGEMINELATKLIKDREYEVVDEIKLTLTQEQAHEIFKSHEQSVRRRRRSTAILLFYRTIISKSNCFSPLLAHISRSSQTCHEWRSVRDLAHESVHCGSSRVGGSLSQRCGPRRFCRSKQASRLFASSLCDESSGVFIACERISWGRFEVNCHFFWTNKNLNLIITVIYREHAILFAEPRRKSTSDEHGGEKKETHHEA